MKSKKAVEVFFSWQRGASVLPLFKIPSRPRHSCGMNFSAPTSSSGNGTAYAGGNLGSCKSSYFGACALASARLMATIKQAILSCLTCVATSAGTKPEAFAPSVTTHLAYYRQTPEALSNHGAIIRQCNGFQVLEGH
jgi:hypothetical protein